MEYLENVPVLRLTSIPALLLKKNLPDISCCLDDCIMEQKWCSLVLHASGILLWIRKSQVSHRRLIVPGLWILRKGFADPCAGERKNPGKNWQPLEVAASNRNGAVTCKILYGYQFARQNHAAPSSLQPIASSIVRSSSEAVSRW